MFRIVIFAILVLFNFNVMANNTLTITDIQQYLNSVRSFQADFLQEDSFGNSSKGRISLQKPFLFRIETFEPNHNVIVGNKTTIIYHDYELNETSHAAANQGAVTLLVADKIDFNNSKIEVKSLKNDNNIIEIEFYDKSQPDAGTMTMVFTNSPIDLRQIKTQKDNNKIIMNFYNKDINKEITKKTFVFQYPKVNLPYPTK